MLQNIQVQEIPRSKLNSDFFDEPHLNNEGVQLHYHNERQHQHEQLQISTTKRLSTQPPVIHKDESNSDPNEKLVSGKSQPQGQIWVRLRPTPRYDDNIFEIGEDGATLKLLVDRKEDRLLDRMLKDGVLQGDDLAKSLTLKVDGILHNASQEEAYTSVVEDVVIKAMDGTSGIVMLMGPEVSGKSFTLFGTPKKYEYRGLVPRALEMVFEIAEMKQDEFQYRIQLGVVEIRENRIKDLFKLGTSEVLRIGKDGPHGMFKDITSVELALTLLMVALSGQKTIARESYAKFHTLVIVDIHGERISEEGKRSFDSRITFGKIASIPKREMTLGSHDSLENLDVGHCIRNRPKTNKSNAWTDVHKMPYQRPKSCCTIKNGPTGESIQIRRDLFQLEQMLMQLNELQRLDRIYTTTQRSGVVMLMKRSNAAPSQFFRQCKLAQCLQDIVTGSSEVRIVLTIRPERQYLHSSLETIRFAQKIKCVPTDFFRSSHANAVREALRRESDNLRKELLALHEEKIRARLGHGTEVGMGQQPNILRMRINETQDFLEGKIPEIKIVDRDQVKVMFETIRQIWKLATEHQSQKELDTRSSVHQTTQFPDDAKVNRKKSRANSINGSRRPLMERKKRGPKGSRSSIDRLPPIAEDTQVNGEAETVVATGHQTTNLIDSTHALHAEDPVEAWKEFVHTFRGEMIVAQINRQISAHHDCADEINGNLEPVCNIVRECLHKISSLLLRDMNLDEVRWSDEVHANINTNTKGDHSDTGAHSHAARVGTASGHHFLAELGVLDVNCDEFFHKMLELCRSALEQHDQIIKQSKAECERLFIQFSHGNGKIQQESATIEEHIIHTAPGQIADQTVTAERGEEAEGPTGPRMSAGDILDFDTLQGRYVEARHYEEMSLQAKRIAKQLMKYYSPRPTWIS